MNLNMNNYAFVFYPIKIQYFVNIEGMGLHIRLKQVLIFRLQFQFKLEFESNILAHIY
jgi:hypothetical protein